MMRSERARILGLLAALPLIGGDYFDWQELPDGKWAFSLADLTGHGIGPALVTTACRDYGRASLPAEPDLGRVMDRINELFVEDLPTGKLVQLAVGILDSSAGRIQLLSAGQGSSC